MMNILEAIEAARANDSCVRRPEWEEDQLLFWKDDSLCWNKPSGQIWEQPLKLFTKESVLATDWIEV